MIFEAAQLYDRALTWSHVELGLAILCANLPTLTALVRVASRRIRTKASASSYSGNVRVANRYNHEDSERKDDSGFTERESKRETETGTEGERDEEAAVTREWLPPIKVRYSGTPSLQTSLDLLRSQRRSGAF
jgi:hypothetical protein